MKKYEILRVIREHMGETRINGFRTIEASNLFRAVVAARKEETQDYDDAIESGDSYYCYPNWLEVWEVGDDGAYTEVRRYVLAMRDMVW